MLVDKNYRQYLDLLASDSPAPGGGSVAAVNAGLASGLIQMVCSLSMDKAGFEEKEEIFKNIYREVEEFKQYFINGVDEDAKAFTGVIQAYKLPKESKEQIAYRLKAIQEAYKEAASVPYNLGIKSYKMVSYLEDLVETCNQFAVTDVSIAGMQIMTSIEASFLNVKINLSYIKDKDFVADMVKGMDQVLKDADKRIKHIKKKVEDKFI